MKGRGPVVAEVPVVPMNVQQAGISEALNAEGL